MAGANVFNSEWLLTIYGSLHCYNYWVGGGGAVVVAMATDQGAWGLKACTTLHIEGQHVD